MPNEIKNMKKIKPSVKIPDYVVFSFLSFLVLHSLQFALVIIIGWRGYNKEGKN